MTDEKLIEGIAIEGATAYYARWDKVSEQEKDNWRRWARERIYPLIKEALSEPVLEDNGEAETRQSLAEGHGITFPNATEAIKWLKESDV